MSGFRWYTVCKINMASLADMTRKLAFLLTLASAKTNIVWWQNGDLGLVWVLEYIQHFIVDSGRWDHTDHKSD